MWKQDLNDNFFKQSIDTNTALNCVSTELCRNDIGREWIDNNYLIYLPLHIVTHDVYSTTRELTS
jgi:hypothetical protein